MNRMKSSLQAEMASVGITGQIREWSLLEMLGTVRITTGAIVMPLTMHSWKLDQNHDLIAFNSQKNLLWKTIVSCWWSKQQIQRFN